MAAGGGRLDWRKGDYKKRAQAGEHEDQNGRKRGGETNVERGALSGGRMKECEEECGTENEPGAALWARDVQGAWR